MNAPTWHPNPPPHGLTKEQIESWALIYAPRLLFHRHERHFPSDPETFRMRSRFRKSRQGKRDHGWNKNTRQWEKGNDRNPRFFGAEPEDLTGQTAVWTGWRTAVDPGCRGTLRPHDERNLHGWTGRKNGLFLERDDSINRRSSGRHPKSGVVSAPVFLDATGVDFYEAGPFVKVLFWFFYELNWWCWLLTHEGDWEHVSYYVSKEDLEKGNPPTVAYFAQHNGGELRKFASLDRVQGDEKHPVMYVDRHGHPTRASVGEPSDYTTRWDTWVPGPDPICTPRWLRDEPWKEFSGAWGEVGETKHTTGPLGPWFKQGRDLLRVKPGPDGQILVSIPKC